jgi:septation ring formation regulator EzrA
LYKSFAKWSRRCPFTPKNIFKTGFKTFLADHQLAQNVERAQDYKVTGNAVSYTKEKAEEYHKQIETKLEEYEGKTKDYVNKLKGMGADAKASAQKQLDKLQEQQDATKKKLAELKSASGKAWEDLRNGMEKSMGELKRGFDEAASQFK